MLLRQVYAGKNYKTYSKLTVTVHRINQNSAEKPYSDGLTPSVISICRNSFNRQRKQKELSFLRRALGNLKVYNMEQT
jgi:hypothetical protein